MTRGILQTSGNKRFIDGYSDDVRLAGPNHLCPPSTNVDITKTGEAIYRKGYFDTEIDLGEDGSTSRPFYVDEYNVSFFACNGKVYMVDHNDGSNVINTGLSLSDTNGRHTRFGYYAGDLYLTNATDGLRKIFIGRLNGAVTTGDAFVTVDTDLNARLKIFGYNSGNLIISGTTEAYTNPLLPYASVSTMADNGSGLIRVTTTQNHNLTTGEQVIITGAGGTTEANGTWTVTRVDATKFDLQSSTFTNAFTSGGIVTWVVSGVIRLNSTATADYADDAICIVAKDISSGKPKGSGLTFWKERMILWGVPYSTDADRSSNTVYMSSFATMDSIENVIDFNTANTAAIEQAGKGGVVTNVLSTRDYLYVFTQNETYFAGVADVVLDSGATPLQLLSNLYGCVNEDCAADLGNGLVAFLTNNHRVIGIRISTETGAAVVFPDESLDIPLRNTVALLDADQSDAFMFYAPNERRLFLHCNVDSERLVLKFNNEIGKWEPPTLGWTFGGMFVYKGATYATELADDTIYQLNTGFQDNGTDYEVNMATSLIEADDGRTTLRLKDVGISGRIGALTTVTVESVVGGGTPTQKSFTAGSSVSTGALGSVTLGATTLGAGSGEDMEEYDKLYAIYPTYGQSYQLRVRSLADVSGGAFSLSSYTVRGNALLNPVLTLQ